MVTSNQALFPGLVSRGGTQGRWGQCNAPGPSPMPVGEGLAGRDTRPLAMSPRDQGGMLTFYPRAATSVHSGDRGSVSHDPPLRSNKPTALRRLVDSSTFVFGILLQCLVSDSRPDHVFPIALEHTTHLIAALLVLLSSTPFMFWGGEDSVVSVPSGPKKTCLILTQSCRTGARQDQRVVRGVSTCLKPAPFTIV